MYKITSWFLLYLGFSHSDGMPNAVTGFVKLLFTLPKMHIELSTVPLHYVRWKTFDQLNLDLCSR